MNLKSRLIMNKSLPHKRVGWFGEKESVVFLYLPHKIKTDVGAGFALTARFLAIEIHLRLYPVVDFCNV
jgi:hypothetical protein